MQHVMRMEVGLEDLLHEERMIVTFHCMSVLPKTYAGPSSL